MLVTLVPGVGMGGGSGGGGTPAAQSPRPSRNRYAYRVTDVIRLILVWLVRSLIWP